LFAPMRNADELLTTGRPLSSRDLRTSIEKRKFMRVGLKKGLARHTSNLPAIFSFSLRISTPPFMLMHKSMKLIVFTVCPICWIDARTVSTKWLQGLWVKIQNFKLLLVVGQGVKNLTPAKFGSPSHNMSRSCSALLQYSF